jgi:CBS domain-containing protein
MLLDSLTKPEKIKVRASLQPTVGKTNVVCVDSDSTLAEAAKMMRQHDVGDVIIIDEIQNRPIGIITDRDIALFCASNGKQDLERVKVQQVLKENLCTASASDDLFAMIEKMKKYGVGRLPLVDERGHLVGIVTSKKILQILVRGIEDLSFFTGGTRKT